MLGGGLKYVVRCSCACESVQKSDEAVFELDSERVRCRWGARGVAVLRLRLIGLGLLLVEGREARELSGGELLLAVGEGVGDELGVVLGLGDAGARLDGVQGAAEHVVVHDPPERQLRRRSLLRVWDTETWHPVPITVTDIGFDKPWQPFTVRGTATLPDGTAVPVRIRGVESDLAANIKATGTLWVIDAPRPGLRTLAGVPGLVLVAQSTFG